MMVTKFELEITVLRGATFLVSNGNNFVARNFARFADIDVKLDKLPLDTESAVARETTKFERH